MNESEETFRAHSNANPFMVSYLAFYFRTSAVNLGSSEKYIIGLVGWKEMKILIVKTINSFTIDSSP
jgi:hypothetical protein